tara:strand:+ start:533 stop:982 length:450 start_codon:yes stop_codon:yes gene_type:complete
MILDKLHKNEVAGIGSVAWPLYMVFKERLVLKKFDDIKNKIPFYSNLLAKDIEKNGLLCPMVINDKNQITDGGDRFEILQKANIKGSLFYVARNREEATFFKKLNNLTWDEHPDMSKLMEKLWQGKNKKYAEKVPHIFTENVKIARPKQ